MIRKSASFALALALTVALGFLIAHAHALKGPGGSASLSTPCDPALPAFKATSESKVASTIDSALAARDAEASAGFVPDRAETVSRAIPPPAPGTYPPLWHRPPPANS